MFRNLGIFHCPNRIGTTGVTSAPQTIASFNPEINVITYQAKPHWAPAMAESLREFDGVVECTDDFDARATIGQPCIMAAKPWVYGAVCGFEGRVMTTVAGSGPCRRCLYPASPPTSCFGGAKGVIEISLESVLQVLWGAVKNSPPPGGRILLCLHILRLHFFVKRFLSAAHCLYPLYWGISNIASKDQAHGRCDKKIYL